MTSSPQPAITYTVYLTNRKDSRVEKPHIFIKINFDLYYPRKRVVKTNAKPEELESLLLEYLKCQGGDSDYSKPHSRNKYLIDIELDPGANTFKTLSDTGNKILTLGIVAAIFGSLNSVKIEPLT